MKFYFIFLSMIVLIFSQNSKTFNKALTEYNSKDYVSAITTFSTLIDSEEKDIAYVMIMMSHYANKEYVNVKKVFSNFMQSTPDNMFLDEAYYIQGKAYFKLKEYTSAIEFWLLSLENTKNDDMTKKVGNLITESLDKMDSEDAYNQFLSNADGERSEALLSIKAADFFERNKKYSNAKNVLNDFVSKYPRSTYNRVFAKRIEKLTLKISNKVYIGILLPFESIPDVSEEIKSGIEYAIKEFEKNSDIQIELRLEDCGTSVLEAIRAAKRLIEDKSIISIIGPLSSDQSSAVSLLAQQNKIPMIAPTASEYGIADISKYVYQMYTDNFTLGKLIAEYAYGDLKYRSFAILSGSDGKSFEVAKGFKETILRLGGEIVAHPVYLEDQAANTKGQFRSIRNLGIKKAFRDSIESADPLITSLQVDSIYTERLRIGNELMEKTGIETDSNRMLVEAIDAIFFPTAAEDLERIIANFAGNNFKINIIGTESWFNPDLFNQNKSYARAMKNMYVFTSRFIDDNSTIGRDFINDFRLAQKATPTEYHFIGYSTSKFLFSALNKKSLNRNDMQLNLSNKDGLIVVGNQINFDHKERVNSGTTILKLTDGIFKKVN